MDNQKPIHAGKQIHTLEELDTARRERRAVISSGVPCFRKPKPAAVVIMQQGITILQTFRYGLYYYEKPKREKKGPRFHKREKVIERPCLGELKSNE